VFDIEAELMYRARQHQGEVLGRCPIDHGAIAPSGKVRSGSGTTRRGSPLRLMRKAQAFGHAPRAQIARRTAAELQASRRPEPQVADSASQVLREALLAVWWLSSPVDELSTTMPCGQRFSAVSTVGQPTVARALDRQESTNHLDVGFLFVSFGGAVSEVH